MSRLDWPCITVNTLAGAGIIPSDIPAFRTSASFTLPAGFAHGGLDLLRMKVRKERPVNAPGHRLSRNAAAMKRHLQFACNVCDVIPFRRPLRVTGFDQRYPVFLQAPVDFCVSLNPAHCDITAGIRCSLGYLLKMMQVGISAAIRQSEAGYRIETEPQPLRMSEKSDELRNQ